MKLLNDIFSPVLLVTDTLEKLSIPYFISGSIASTSYGLVRTTLDADLVADLPLSQVDAFAKAIQGTFYVDVPMIQNAIAHQSSFNVIHLETMFKVDVFISQGREFDRVQFERRRKRALDEAEGNSAYFASPEDVLLSKLAWYRQGGEVSDRQWQDVLGIIKVQGVRLDLEHLHKWADNLRVTDLLERALVEAGRD